MRTTTRWGLVVPNANTDPDDVPTHVGDLADQLDAILGAPGGTLAARPVASIAGRLYYVTTGTSAGTLFRDNGTGWDQLGGSIGASSDVVTLGWGDSPKIGTSGKGYAAADHDHGTPANPVVAHVAATDPHPQYLQKVNAINTFTVPFHISGVFTTGIKAPKWVAPRACTLMVARSYLNTGPSSGTCSYTVYKNGSTVEGNAPAVSGAGYQKYDFTDFTLAEGDYLQLGIGSTGTNAADWSITVEGVWN